jgi:hypothetical protein
MAPIGSPPCAATSRRAARTSIPPTAPLPWPAECPPRRGRDPRSTARFEYRHDPVLDLVEKLARTIVLAALPQPIAAQPLVPHPFAVLRTLQDRGRRAGVC